MFYEDAQDAWDLYSISPELTCTCDEFHTCQQCHEEENQTNTKEHKIMEAKELTVQEYNDPQLIIKKLKARVNELEDREELLLIEKSKSRGAAEIYKDELIKAEGLIKLHENTIAKQEINYNKMRDLEYAIAIRKQTNHIPVEFKIRNERRYVIKVLANTPELMAYTYYKYDRDIYPDLQEGGEEISLEQYLKAYQEYIGNILLSKMGEYNCTINEIDTAKDRFHKKMEEQYPDSDTDPRDYPEECSE